MILNVYMRGRIMKKKRFYIRTGILLVLLAALGYTLYSAVFQNTESVAVGESFPFFRWRMLTATVSNWTN